MPSIDPAILALIATIFGGVGLKVVEHWLGKSKNKIDEAASFREEYRLQIEEQKEEIKQLEIDVDKWRDQYYAIRDEYLTAKTEYAIKLDNLQRLLDQAKSALENNDDDDQE